MLLTRIAHEGALPLELAVKPEAYDAWFRAKVLAALDDRTPHLEQEEVEARFAAKRDALMEKADRLRILHGAQQWPDSL